MPVDFFIGLKQVKPNDGYVIYLSFKNYFKINRKYTLVVKRTLNF